MAEPLHEVACPECGTTIRARMADQPGEDLRVALESAKPDWMTVIDDWPLTVAVILPSVQAYVDSQVAAARADERAKAAAPVETSIPETPQPTEGPNAALTPREWGQELNEWWGCLTRGQKFTAYRRTHRFEADRG